MSLKVSICISTYKRPEGLRQLLNGLDSLIFPNIIEDPDIEVIVVDNDSQGSAAAICDELTNSFRWCLSYQIEPKQGVTYARNRSVQLISEESIFVAFIDDDEIPSPVWLDELMSTQKEFDADVVTGPVYPRFEEETIANWISKGRFFNPPDRETGTNLEIAYTNNVLVRAACLRDLAPVFDEDLAFRGSEDVHLFMRLFKSGAKIVWSNEAIVHESIPSERTRLSWLLKRNYYGWSCHSLLEKRIFPSLRGQLERSIKGIMLFIFGLLIAFPSVFLGRYAIAKSLIYMCRGIGTLSGLMGYQGAWGGANR